MDYTVSRDFHISVNSSAISDLGIPSDEAVRFLRRAIIEHEKALESNPAAIRKNAPESRVTVVEFDGGPEVCVKEFRPRGIVHALKGLFRPTHGLATFRNGLRLDEAAVPVARPLGLLRKFSVGLIHTEWVVMEVVPEAVEFDRYVLGKVRAGWPAAEKQAFVRSFGRLIGSLHTKGVFHADLKTCNIVVQENPSPSDSDDRGRSGEPTEGDAPVRFALLDYDEVDFTGRMTERRRVKNLVQIFLSAPTALDAKDRMRFLREYAREVGLTAAQKRRIADGVIERARDRTILYVGFDGDVIETWNADT